MKFSSDDLLALTTPDGGRFAASSLEESQRFCRRLAHGHYENFPVGSVLIPRRLHHHFYSIYAFSRLADDIADELPAERSREKFAALEAIEHLLLHPETLGRNPIFQALHHTIEQKSLPTLPFQKLLIAFRMDSAFQQAATYRDLEHYCAHSAHPIGELVLRLFDLYTADRAPLSDALCTGLQLANFWQDFSRDLPIGRVFVPEEVLEQCGLEASELLALYAADRKNADEQALILVKERFFQCFTLLFHQTKSYFARGKALLPSIPYKRLRAELAFTIAGGERIVEQSYKLQHRILLRRVRLSKRDIPALLAQSVRYYCG